MVKLIWSLPKKHKKSLWKKWRIQNPRNPVHLNRQRNKPQVKTTLNSTASLFRKELISLLKDHEKLKESEKKHFVTHSRFNQKIARLNSVFITWIKITLMNMAIALLLKPNGQRKNSRLRLKLAIRIVSWLRKKKYRN